MGGADIAVVNDETALLINPAALGKLRDSFGTLIDPELEGNVKFSNIYLNSSFTQPFNLEKVKDALDVSRDTFYHAKGQTFPSFVTKNFGIGLFARQLMDAKMNTAGTSMTTYSLDDMALVMGFNFRLFDGRVKLGASGRFISRIEIDKEVDPAGPMDRGSHASEGAAMGTDVGLILTGPWAWLPTITAVARDVGGTNFTNGSGLRMTTTTRPTKVEQDYDVAIGLFPIHSTRSRSSFAFQYNQITAAGKAQDKSRFYHLGYELNLSDLIFLRAGMNQRYWTGGFEFASEHFQMQLASYGEDVGADGTAEEDRRYIFKFAFRF